jgi:hypothetical protein
MMLFGPFGFFVIGFRSSVEIRITVTEAISVLKHTDAERQLMKVNARVY